MGILTFIVLVYYFTSIGRSYRRYQGRMISSGIFLNEELDASQIVKRALEDPEIRAALYDAIAEESARRKQQQP
jgi:hypothetical protein